MERAKWYEREPGHTSAMRIIAMMSAATGCATVIAGVIGMFLGYAEAVAIAGVGGGMSGLGELSKAWQAKTEPQKIVDREA